MLSQLQCRIAPTSSPIWTRASTLHRCALCRALDPWTMHFARLGAYLDQSGGGSQGHAVIRSWYGNDPIWQAWAKTALIVTQNVFFGHQPSRFPLCQSALDDNALVPLTSCCGHIRRSDLTRRVLPHAIPKKASEGMHCLQGIKVLPDRVVTL